MLHTGLSLPCSSLSVTLCSGRDRRLRPYPCGLIFSTGAFPILYLLPSWCSRCARSCTVQVPSEQPCLLDWLPEFLDLLVRILMPVLEEKQRQKDFSSFLMCHFGVFPDYVVVFSQARMLDSQILRTLRSYLECGSSVSLISSGLTKCCNSSVFSTDTLSRSRLSLFLNQIFSLEEEKSLGLSK